MFIALLCWYSARSVGAQCFAPTGLDSIVGPGAINISSLWDENDGQWITGH
jgi:hypothetical protein